MVPEELLADLAVEGDQLRAAVADLPDDRWRTPTPAAGWDVATQIAHLAWTDECALASATDRAAWHALVEVALADIDGVVDKAALSGGAVPPAELLARWDAARAALPPALRRVEGRMQWFGPPMSPASMATARFMETWAHGLDVREALGLPVERTDRIRHVCHLGVRTRGFAFTTHGLPAPTHEVRVELASPSGERWQWGPEEAAERVRGSAWDFARLVTQRVHRDDTHLVTSGAEAERWLTIAQAFAGPAGEGRPRG
ncbi:TIGR03084 family metal-binding protein [Nocardioides sp. BP30]|uniref:TIGR03084 family metal-binding protein n=1 Tax=Nocardioides sp. BP30 TaxID=3036374 RepID=UPI0024691A7F|nr:TIGR03084 family metal-binding protein [Nocardioides sp. BP30]WGL52719.1 TIGR03084 family metal-binding protein [Nocardioides sp. BP30]